MCTFVFFRGLSTLALQQAPHLAQLKWVTYLTVVVVVVAFVVLTYIWWALRMVLKTTGFTHAGEEELSLGWIEYLYILIIALGFFSLYLYAQLG